MWLLVNIDSEVSLPSVLPIAWQSQDEVNESGPA